MMDRLSSLSERRHFVWGALIAIGLIGGVVFDETPARQPEVHRAGYRVLEADFHAHTTYSDGALSPFTLVRQAGRHGLDVIGVTEHNTVLAAKIARTYSKAVGGQAPIVVVGEEVTTARFHIIALGLTDTVRADQPPKDVIAKIHAQNGIAIAAHPVQHFWPELLPIRADFDGAEVMHPIAYASRSSAWRWADMITFYEDGNREALSNEGRGRPSLMAIGSSDFHFGSVLGICRTLVFIRDQDPMSEKSVMEALHAHRTVVIDHTGRLWGDPAMVKALEQEPYTPRVADYRYEGEGSGDRVFRTLGWLGLVGLVVFGWSGKKKTSRPSGSGGKTSDESPERM